MDHQFSNILRGTRQFFQGVPTSSADSSAAGAAGWPYQLFPGVGSGSITRGTSDGGERAAAAAAAGWPPAYQRGPERPERAGAAALRQRSPLEPRGPTGGPLQTGQRAPWPAADGLYAAHPAAAPQAGGGHLGDLLDYYGRQQLTTAAASRSGDPQPAAQPAAQSAYQPAATLQSTYQPAATLQSTYPSPAPREQQRLVYNHGSAPGAAYSGAGLAVSGDGQLLDLRPGSAAPPPPPADTGQPRKRLSTEVLDLSVRRGAEERPRSVMPTLPSQSVARQQREPRPESVPPPARAPLDTLNSPPASRPASQAAAAPPQCRSDGFRSPADATTAAAAPLNFSPRASPTAYQPPGGVPIRISPSPQQPPPRASPASQQFYGGAPQRPEQPRQERPAASRPDHPPGHPATSRPDQAQSYPATRPDQPPGHPSTRPDHPPGHPASRSDLPRQEKQPNAPGRPAYGGPMSAEPAPRFGPPPPAGPGQCPQPGRPPGSALPQPGRPGYPAPYPHRMPAPHHHQQPQQPGQKGHPQRHQQQRPPAPPHQHQQPDQYQRHGQMGQQLHPAMRSGQPPSQQQQQQQQQHHQQQLQQHISTAARHPGPPRPPHGWSPVNGAAPRSGQPPAPAVGPFARPVQPSRPAPRPLPTPWGPQNGPLTSQSGPAGGKRPPDPSLDRPSKAARRDSSEGRPRHRQPSEDLAEASSLEELLRNGLNGGTAGHSPQDLALLFPNMKAATSPEKHVQPLPPPAPAARSLACAGELDIYNSVTSFINESVAAPIDSLGQARPPSTARPDVQGQARPPDGLGQARPPTAPVDAMGQARPAPAAPVNAMGQARPPAGPLGQSRPPADLLGQARADPLGQSRPPAGPLGQSRPPADLLGQARPPEPRKVARRPSTGSVSPRGGRTPPSLHVAGAPVEFRRAQGPFMTPEQERCLEGQLSRYERQIRQVPSSQSAAAAVRVRTKAEMKSPSASAPPPPPPPVRQSTSTESNKSVFDFDSGSDGEVPVLSHKVSARAKVEPPPERPLVDVFGDGLDSDFWGSVCNSLAENIESNQKLVKSKRVTRTKIVSKFQEVTSGKAEPAEEPEPETLEPPPPKAPSPQPVVKTEPDAEENQTTANSAPQSTSNGVTPPVSKAKVEPKPEKSGSEFELSQSGDESKSSSDSSESQDSSESSDESEVPRRPGRRAVQSSDSDSGAGDARRPARRRGRRAVSSDSSDSEPRPARRPLRRRRPLQQSDSSQSSDSDAPSERRLRTRRAGRPERRVTRSAGSRRRDGRTRSRRAAKRLVFEDGLPAPTRRKRKEDVESDSNGSASGTDAPRTRNSSRAKHNNEKDSDDGRGGRRKLRRRKAVGARTDSADSADGGAGDAARDSTRTLRLRDGSNASEKGSRDGSVARGARAGRTGKAGASATKAVKPARSSEDEAGDGSRAKCSVSESEAVADSVQKPPPAAPSAGGDGDAKRDGGAAGSSGSGSRRRDSAESRTIPSILDVLLPPHEERDELDIIHHYPEDYREVLERVAEVLTRQRPRARFARERFSASAVADAWAEGWQERFFAWKTGICRVPPRLVPKLQRKSVPAEAPGTPTRKGTPRKEARSTPTPARTPSRAEAAPTADRKNSARFSQEEGGRRERHRSASQKSVDLICAKVMASSGEDAPAPPSQRFVLRAQRKTRVDIIEARLLAAVNKQLPGGGGDRSPATTNGPSAAPEPIVNSLVKKYKSITDRQVERRMGALYSRRSEVLHYAAPSLLDTPRPGQQPVPAALLFPRATVERFARELADSPLADGAAPAVVLDSRTRGARAQITEKELLHQVFGVSLDEISQSLETPPASVVPARGRRVKKRRTKNRSGFDFMLKKKRKKETDTDSVVPRNKKLRPVCGPRMGADPTRSPELAAEIRSWVLNKSAGETALLRAAKLGYLDAVIYLLETGEDATDCRDNASFTPLHEACARGHLDVAKTLLLYGADVNVSARGGVRPLHEAVENNHPELVRLLLAYGSDPRLPTYAGISPLEQCANMPVMKRLLHGHVEDLEGSTGSGWHFVACQALEPWPSGMLLSDGAPAFTPRADDANLTFDMAEAALPAIYRRLNDSQPAPAVRYVTLSALAAHLACSEEAVLRERPELQLLEVGSPEDAAELVCQTVAGWALRPADGPARLVRLDRDVEMLLRRERFNMTC
ncbi:serine/arginine repetitive matrix protein 2-like [Amphibalanus amphitrite]|uniref:serine/arginine repetitive matrix protein 2-like n=1 Tax=Amphibalanus amphitrite TaxID=1232801 RepID=UPI001C924CD0|nr:serine/arginine repetitive matrix protein 2-like [Amphibalanus amphitrite]